MRTEAASNPTCSHFGLSCRQGILPDLSNSDCLPGRAGGTPVGLAILNLTVNARDAMPEGGALTVTTETVRLAGKPGGLAGNFIAVRVKDTGKGIPPEVLGRVFEPFFTTKEPGKGTGLGLSMVYGFAQQSHGAVTIESKFDRGTSVVIYLPVSAPNGEEATIARVPG
jgi:signal transduction histidine kinase